MNGATRSNLIRMRSLPAQQMRGFAVANPSELSSDDDDFSDVLDHGDGDEDEEGEGGEDDQYSAAVVLKLPSFFSSSNQLLVSAHGEAERQAR